MSEQEYQDLYHRIDEAIVLSKKKLLAERALHGEDIVVLDPESGKVVSIPAASVLANHPEFRM